MSESVHHVRFVKIGRSWVAQIFCDENTCVSWQRAGSMRDVKRIIREQLNPASIDATIEEVSE